jgi:hypothetical protein
METLSAFLDRKHEELELLNGCLGSPLVLQARDHDGLAAAGRLDNGNAPQTG